MIIWKVVRNLIHSNRLFVNHRTQKPLAALDDNPIVHTSIVRIWRDGRWISRLHARLRYAANLFVHGMFILHDFLSTLAASAASRKSSYAFMY